MKKIICFVLSVSLVLALVLPMAVSAAEPYILATIEDYTALGVTEGGSSVAYDSGDGRVVNFRCNVKAAKTETSSDKVDFYWLIPKSGGQVSTLYLGDSNSFDMSRVTKITMDYLSNHNSDVTDDGKVNTFILSKDKEGTQIVAKGDVTQFPSKAENSMTTVHTVEIAVVDNTYNGPLYLYLDTDVRMFVGNLQMTIADAAPETPDEPTDTPTEPENPPADPETPADNDTVDFSKLPTAGTFTAAGYPETQMLLNYQNGGVNQAFRHSIGTIDGSKYAKVVISYGNDPSAKNNIGVLKLMTASGTVIAQSSLAGSDGWTNTTTVEFDLAGYNGNEELILGFDDNSMTNGIVVTEIAFEAGAASVGDFGVIALAFAAVSAIVVKKKKEI